MWLTSGRASGRNKTLLQFTSLTLLESECYEGEVQPYRKTDYKPIIYIGIKLLQEWLTNIKKKEGLFTYQVASTTEFS